MASQRLTVKSKAAMAEVLRHLENLVDALKEGQVCICKNDESITLKPYDPVLLTIEAEARLEKTGLRETLVIEMKWRKSKALLAVGDPFTISHLDASAES